MAKGLGILIAPARGKRSMYDEGADEAPESEREHAAGSMMDDLRTVLGGDADEDQLEAFKALCRACFEEYEREPHEEGPHTNEDDDEE